jgi:hypothetical protein
MTDVTAKRFESNDAEPMPRPATPEHPFMHHCHILEHEDAGMMGQYVCAWRIGSDGDRMAGRGLAQVGVEHGGDDARQWKAFGGQR